jgi:hypothetical protein
MDAVVPTGEPEESIECIRSSTTQFGVRSGIAY